MLVAGIPSQADEMTGSKAQETFQPPWAALMLVEACPANRGRVDDRRHGDKVVQQHPVEKDLQHTVTGIRIACMAYIASVTVTEC